MWLDRLIVVNYKSCGKLNIKFQKDEPTVFVGINDCGKSSVLKAVGLLLEKQPNFHFPTEEKKKNDFANTRIQEEDFIRLLSENGLPEMHYSTNCCYLFGKFGLEVDDINNDYYAGFSNHLQWLLDNREDNNIWLLRIFNNEDQSNRYYLLTRDGIIQDEPARLYNENATNLKKIATDLSIDVTNENNQGRYKNSEYVTSIYSTLSLEHFWIEYSKPDYKYFPVFKYLDWNITMEELKKVAEEAINTRVEEYLNTVKRLASTQAGIAQQIVNTELQRFTERFATDFPNIEAFKANINFDVTAKLTDIFVNKRNTDNDIHLDSQGEGVKRQIWFALIKWTALSSLEQETDCKKFIWCFDEPETHLYPKAQRELFEIIKQVANKNIQCILSTHSTIFIDRSNFETIHRFELLNGYTNISSCLGVQDIYSVLEIRNSDFLFYDNFIVVEGDTEEILLPHFFRVYCGTTLNRHGIQIINLGGKSKRKQNFLIFKQLLTSLNKAHESVIYLFDKDIEYDDDFTAREREGLKITLVGKQDIEDSIISEIWVKLINSEFGDLGHTVTVDEVNALKGAIPDSRIQSNQKFYPKLIDHMKLKVGKVEFYHLVNDRLPSKGRFSGELLCKYIEEHSHIPDEIFKMFESLNTN